jgi:hypothetical protein
MDGFALLTSSDRGQAAQLAQSLEEMNKKRQSIELATVDRAVQQAEEMLGREGSAPRSGGGRRGLARRRAGAGCLAPERAVQQACLRAGPAQGMASRHRARPVRFPVSTWALRCALLWKPVWR